MSHDSLRDTALHFSQLRELHGSVQHLDVCADAFTLVALTVVVLALEPGVSGFLPPALHGGRSSDIIELLKNTLYRSSKKPE